MRSRRHSRRLLFSTVAAVAMVIACGCASGGKQPSGAGARIDTTTVKFRSLAAGAADNYVTAVTQAMDQLRRTTTRPEVADWAWQNKIATALASFTNATGPNDAVCLLDMVVLVTLKRDAMEEHWVPNLLHEEGKQVLEVYRRAESDIWDAAAQALTPGQQAQLKELIERWRREHPGQYYVSHVRFADMAAAMKVTATSAEAKGPGSVFGLLQIDPLAGLDPVTQELRNYRALSERVIYMSVRMPMVLGWQVEYVATRITATPEMQRVANSTEQFAKSTDQFVKVVGTYPADLAKERQAALAQAQTLVSAERQAMVDQVARAVAKEREAITREVTTQQSSVRQIIADVQRVVETTARATESANAETSKTIARTEEAGRRSMVLAFRLGLAVILVVIVGSPLTLLLYRIASRRWAGSAASSDSPPTSRSSSSRPRTIG